MIQNNDYNIKFQFVDEDHTATLAELIEAYNFCEDNIQKLRSLPHGETIGLADAVIPGYFGFLLVSLPQYGRYQFSVHTVIKKLVK
jgi:hypothetical protein